MTLLFCEHYRCYLCHSVSYYITFTEHLGEWIKEKEIMRATCSKLEEISALDRMVQEPEINNEV